MRNIIHHITRPVIVYGAMGVALIIVSGIIGWPYMISHYGMFRAIVFMSLSVIFAVIFAYGFAGHTHLGLKHRHIDLRAYERERSQGLQQTPLPLSGLSSTEISEDEPAAPMLPGRTMKALPPVRHRRMLVKPSPQAVRTGSGHVGGRTDGKDADADGRTIPSGRTLDADTQADADKRKILLYQQQYPGASVRLTADAVGMGKTKVAEIINQLKGEGAL